MLIVSQKTGLLENLMILKSYVSSTCVLLRLWYTTIMAYGDAMLVSYVMSIIENHYHSTT